MRKIERELRKVIEDDGFEVVQITSKGKHFKWILRKHGIECQIPVSTTPSDWRYSRQIIRNARASYAAMKERNQDGQ